MSDSITIEIVYAVAESMDKDPTELPELSRVIDTDALDALFPPNPDHQPHTNLVVQFTYADHIVQIHGRDHIEINPVTTKLKSGTPTRN